MRMLMLALLVVSSSAWAMEGDTKGKRVHGKTRSKIKRASQFDSKRRSGTSTKRTTWFHHMTPEEFQCLPAATQAFVRNALLSTDKIPLGLGDLVQWLEEQEKGKKLDGSRSQPKLVKKRSSGYLKRVLSGVLRKSASAKTTAKADGDSGDDN